MPDDSALTISSSTTPSSSVAAERAPHPVRNCFWCLSPDRHQIAVRADGMEIHQCRACGHRAVRDVALDLDEIYQQPEYFCKQDSNAIGYKDYNSFSISDWSAELFGALLLMENVPGASVIDIGCASGIFLDLCRPFGIKTYGVEPSPWGQAHCRSKGHQILCDRIDNLSADTISNLTLVTGFHVIEHLIDLPATFAILKRYIAGGGKVLFVFPNVNFEQDNWSGSSDSFEHISYFYPEFVKTRFSEALATDAHVVWGPNLIYCFAGNISNPALNGIGAAGALAASGESMSDTELMQTVQGLTTAGALFVVTFLARNRSAALAKRVLSALAGTAALDSNYKAICEAFVSLQNGNVYGAASALSDLSSHQPELHFLEESLERQLPSVLRASPEDTYPIVTVWVCCAPGAGISKALIKSLGAQTYPHIEVLHIHCGPCAECELPPAFAGLITSLDISDLAPEAAWQRAVSASRGDFILWMDSTYLLSEYCVFALYYPLLEYPHTYVHPQLTAVSQPGSPRSIGQRALRKVLKLIGQDGPPIVLFNKRTSGLSPVSPLVITNRARRSRYFSRFEGTFCPDLLAHRL